MDQRSHQSIQNAHSLHKEMLYNMVTNFAKLDTFISHYLASVYNDDFYERIKFTDIVLSNDNSQHLFKYFTIALSENGIDKVKIANLEKLYNHAKKLRNVLSHSYLVPTNNLNFNGKAIKLTYINDSNGKGYTRNVQKNEYDICYQKLQLLIREVYVLLDLKLF